MVQKVSIRHISEPSITQQKGRKIVENKKTNPN
jgi:hypothetical protein